MVRHPHSTTHLLFSWRVVWKKASSEARDGSCSAHVPCFDHSAHAQHSANARVHTHTTTSNGRVRGQVKDLPSTQCTHPPLFFVGGLGGGGGGGRGGPRTVGPEGCVGAVIAGPVRVHVLLDGRQGGLVEGVGRAVARVVPRVVRGPQTCAVCRWKGQGQAQARDKPMNTLAHLLASTRKR